MSRHSPGQSTYNYKPENNKRQEKSYTKAEGINRNPSTPMMNPYFQQLGQKTIDKKKSTFNVGYQGSVLLQQNKQLLAQNQEMAILIHEKNMMIETLERSYNNKVEQQIQMLKEVETQKQRFISEVIRHKEQTDATICQLEEALNHQRDEKAEMEKRWNRERINLRQTTEQDQRNEMQKLKVIYQQNIQSLQAEKMKLKAEIDRLGNEHRLSQSENKQKVSKLQYDIQRSKDQLKHAEHVRKLQLSQLKQFYENKLQKMHLEYRRDKEVFLIEHENQIKRLNQQIDKLREQIEVLEDAISKKDDKIKSSVKDTRAQNEKQRGKMQETILEIKQKCNKDKKVLYDMFDVQSELTKTANGQHVSSLEKQNQRLTECLKIKQKQQAKLYAEIDLLRGQYCTDLEQYEQTIKELISKMYTNEIGGQEEKECLKAKLAVLREADLNSFKGYYDNQLAVMNEKLAQKDQIISLTRQKLHDQLRKKAETKKQYEMEFGEYRSKIIDQNNKINDLQAQILAGDKDRAADQQASIAREQKTSKIKDKTEVNRQGQLNHLKAIIESKDQEIQQLGNKIKLLNSNHILELKQKDEERTQLEHHKQALLAEKTKVIDRLENELSKYKQLLKKEKEEFEKDLIFMNNQRRRQVDTVSEDLTSNVERYEQNLNQLKSQIKSLNLQIMRLKKKLDLKEREHAALNTQIQVNQKAQASKDKQVLEQFYKQQLKFRDDQIINLKERNDELSNDVLDARENYANLQKKLQSLIQSQSALRQMEQKVLNMGQQNNLIKNIVQLTK